jgi:hypothetical protein
MLTRLSPIKPSPTQRFIPVSPLYRSGQSMPPLDHADTSLASGPPFLAIADPAFFLLAFAFWAFGVAIWNANAFDALRFRFGFVLVGVESGVRRYQAGVRPSLT